MRRSIAKRPGGGPRGHAPRSIGSGSDVPPRDVTGSLGWQRFNSCGARLDRAAEHLHAFVAAWAAFVADHPYRGFVEVDDDGSGVMNGPLA